MREEMARSDADLVLIIEDNDKAMKLARDILRFHGFGTIEAASGEEGIVLAKERDPAVILMDIQLPGMDGIAALRRLREDAATARIPVLAVTASVMKEDRERMDEAGFDGFITKPFDVDLLAGQVQAAVARCRR
jgi:two-component system cell cycle response regulator DivK